MKIADEVRRRIGKLVELSDDMKLAPPATAAATASAPLRSGLFSTLATVVPEIREIRFSAMTTGGPSTWTEESVFGCRLSETTCPPIVSSTPSGAAWATQPRPSS